MKRLFSVLALIFAVSITHAQWNSSHSDVPAFHKAPPAEGEKLPPILTQRELAESGMTQAAQKEAYNAAAKIPGVLHQLPCYCYCHRNHGHHSLRSCFEGTHGANCNTCMAEALYAYQMTKKGWSVRMIRDAIIRGDFKVIDLQNPAPVM
jgi:hypothetical protein